MFEEFENKISLAVAIIVFIALFASYFVAKKACLVSYENYEPQYSIFGGCRIMSDGKLTPVDIVRELR